MAATGPSSLCLYLRITDRFWQVNLGQKERFAIISDFAIMSSESVNTDRDGEVLEKRNKGNKPQDSVRSISDPRPQITLWGTQPRQPTDHTSFPLSTLPRGISPERDVLSCFHP